MPELEKLGKSDTIPLSKGGKRAAANLTPEQRRERARRAALARWKKR